MQEQESIKELEAEIDLHERMILALCSPGSMKTWSRVVRRYHALNIKLCRMQGEQPIVNNYRPDCII